MKMEYLVMGIIVVFVGAFAFASMGLHEWSGSDDQAEDVIASLTGGTYQPWTHSIWEPPSGEIESLLFALQAAIGSIIIGYFLGYYRALSKMKATETREEIEGMLNAKPS